MTRNGSETDSGMARNNSDLLGMNFNPILSPGKVRLKIFMAHFIKDKNFHILVKKKFMENIICPILP